MGTFREVEGSMSSMDRSKAITNRHTVGGRKPYVAPACRRLTPEAAKEILLLHKDPNDPEVRHMLECIDEMQKKKSA